MEYLVTGSEMKHIDTYSIDTVGIPSLVLMERAALAFADAIRTKWQMKCKTLILCGTGNNGADGLALLRILSERGYPAAALIVGPEEKASDEFRTQLAIVKNLKCSLYRLQNGDSLKWFEQYELIVDAIFGIGLEREITGVFADVINQIALLDAKVAAVDIPSGIHSGTGNILGTAVRADLTVTFGCRKRGMLLYPGKEYCGQVVTAAIGFPAESMEQAKIGAFTYGKEDLGFIPVRSAYSNKGTFGKVLVIAGSKNMSGAAYFSAMAAYRMGAGLVRILTVEDNRQILQSQLPEAILTSFLPEDLDDSLVEEACTWAGTIVIGPGMGREPYVYQLIESVLRQAYVPMIMDADALNTISSHSELTSYFTENIIITPHPGEMSRLVKRPVKEILAAPAKIASDYAGTHGITCVLKGAATVAAGIDSPIYINDSGNSGMATAGTGDVLTGVIAGLLALGIEEFQSACLGVYLHGLAGDAAKEKVGEYAMTASDVLDSLASVMKFGGCRNEAL